MYGWLNKNSNHYTYKWINKWAYRPYYTNTFCTFGIANLTAFKCRPTNISPCPNFLFVFHKIHVCICSCLTFNTNCFYLQIDISCYIQSGDNISHRRSQNQLQLKGTTANESYSYFVWNCERLLFMEHTGRTSFAFSLFNWFYFLTLTLSLSVYLSFSLLIYIKNGARLLHAGACIFGIWCITILIAIKHFHVAKSLSRSFPLSLSLFDACFSISFYVPDRFVCVCFLCTPVQELMHCEHAS